MGEDMPSVILATAPSTAARTGWSAVFTSGNNGKTYWLSSLALMHHERISERACLSRNRIIFDKFRGHALTEEQMRLAIVIFGDLCDNGMPKKEFTYHINNLLTVKSQPKKGKQA